MAVRTSATDAKSTSTGSAGYTTSSATLGCGVTSTIIIRHCCAVVIGEFHDCEQ